MKLVKNITKHIYFKLVEADDAVFILSLRTDESKNKYLSHVNSELASQKQWIIDYKLRELKNLEYYYIIMSKEVEQLGVVRLYDFREDSFCWGSWILKNDAPVYSAIESALYVYEIGFCQLGFERSHFDVRKENKKVVNFHNRFGASIVKEDGLNYYFTFSKSGYFETRRKYKKFFCQPDNY